MKRIVTGILTGSAGLLLLVGAGCATTYDTDSDIPWNTPQQWESAPSIPGLDGYR